MGRTAAGAILPAAVPAGVAGAGWAGGAGPSGQAVCGVDTVSLRAKLTLLLWGLALLIVAGLGGSIYREATATLAARSREHLAAVATVQEARVNAAMETWREVTGLLTGRAALRQALVEYAVTKDQQLAEPLRAMLLEAQKYRPDLRELTLISADGRIIASTHRWSEGRLAGSEVPARGRLADLRLERAERGGDHQDELRLQFQAPITDDQRYLGVLRLTVRDTRLAAIVGDYTGLGETGETLLARRELGTEALVLAPLRSEPDAWLRRRFQGEDSPLIRLFLERRPLFLGPAPDYRGVPVLAAGRYLPAWDWGLLVKMDCREAQAPERELLLLLLGTSAALLVLLLLLGAAAARWLTAPLAQVTAFAARVRQGDLYSRLESHRRDELGALARAFDEMAAGLLRARDEMEHRITERTAELTEANSELRREIAERTRAEKALRESEEQLRRTVLNAPVPIIVHAEDGQITMLSNTWAEISGYTLAETPTVGDWATRTLGDEGARVTQTLRASFARDTRVAEGEIAVRTRAGEVRTWDFHSAPLGQTADGRRLRVTMAVDVTQRKLAEDALLRRYDKLELWVAERTAELRRAKDLLEAEVQQRRWAEEELIRNAEHLRIFVERLPLAVAMLDRDMRYVLVSRRWLQDYGIEDAYPVGRSFYEIFPDVAPATRELHQRCLKGEVQRCDEEMIRRPNGHVDWTRWEIRPWERGSGDIGGLIMFTEIITDRKQTEEQLARKARDLSHSNAELEHFAYVVSHDLQEPLRAITGFLQLLKKRHGDKLPQDGAEFIQFAVEGAERMRQLIADLLLYSRAGTQDRTANTIDLRRALDAALRNLGPAIEESQAKVTCGELPAVTADTTQLVQLFQNLVGNAIKYHGPRPPEIRISVRQEHQQYVFAVADNGIGIAPEHHERIFKVFERLHTREEYPGTGIGLAICKKIVENHGGRIWVESNVGEGSTFYFSLPVSFRPSGGAAGQDAAGAPQGRLPGGDHETSHLHSDRGGSPPPAGGPAATAGRGTRLAGGR